MPEHEFLEARVLVNDEPLEEYNVPEDEETVDGEIVRYIEATVDAQFKVLVGWKPGYPLKKAEWFHSNLKLDGISRSWSWSHNSASGEGGVVAIRKKHVFDHTPVKDDSGQWKKMLFSFGALEITDRAGTLTYSTPFQNQMLGSIRIVFYRAERKARAKAKWDTGMLPNPLETLSESQLKGSDVGHNIRYHLTEQTARPSENKYKYIRLPGIAGGKTVFIFKYRSRDTLQSLGCITRTPSPTRDNASELGRTRDMLRHEKEERRKADLENARLRRHLEHIQQLVGGGTPMQSTVPLKRERDIKDEQDNEHRKAHVPTKARVTIEIDDD